MQSVKNEIKEKSVIEICIIRSKQINQMRKALIVLSSAKTEVLRCSRRFPTEDKLQELIIEIKNSISELQMSIAKLLKPMVATEGIELDNKYWISSDDIRSG